MNKLDASFDFQSHMGIHVTVEGKTIKNLCFKGQYLIVIQLFVP